MIAKNTIIIFIIGVILGVVASAVASSSQTQRGVSKVVMGVRMKGLSQFFFKRKRLLTVVREPFSHESDIDSTEKRLRYSLKNCNPT